MRAISSSRHRLVGRKSKRVVRITSEPFCCTWLAEHFAQGLVHQVGGRVVVGGALAGLGVDPGGDGVADGQFAGLRPLAVMAEHVGLDLLGVLDRKDAMARARARPRRRPGRRIRRRTGVRSSTTTATSPS
jgi:hypothetical protein